MFTRCVCVQPRLAAPQARLPETASTPSKSKSARSPHSGTKAVRFAADRSDQYLLDDRIWGDDAAAALVPVRTSPVAPKRKLAPKPAAPAINPDKLAKKVRFTQAGMTLWLW